MDKKNKKPVANCDYCINYEYDDDLGYYVCDANLDEDEMSRFIRGNFKDCPYFRYGNEYTIVKKQM